MFSVGGSFLPPAERPRLCRMCLPKSRLVGRARAGSSRCAQATLCQCGVTVLKAVPSKSKPDRGAVTSFVEVINQGGEVVMTFKVVNIIAKRSSES